MKFFFAFAAFCLFFSVNSAFAQTTKPSPTKADDVVVISTNLIQIDATVVDRDGKPVNDLTAADFEIFEEGKKQTITNFSLVKSNSSKATSAAEIQNNAKNAPPVPSGGAPLKPEQVRRTIALVVDDLGLSFAGAKDVRAALKNFVDNQMQPGDLVAIIRTGGGAGALQQFTGDKRILYAAIEKVQFNLNGRVGYSSFNSIESNTKEESSGYATRSGEGAGREAKIYTGIEQERENELKALDSYKSQFTAGTLGAVGYVLRGMSRLPGRKAVMLFSEGFVLTSRSGLNADLLHALRNLADYANRSGTVIYTIDPRGLVAPGGNAWDDIYGLNSTVSTLMESADRQVSAREAKLFNTQQSLQYIARETGGFAITNQNSLSKGIETVLSDQSSYYLIGYEPDDEIFDADKRRYNKLTIRLRRPGLTARYRSGFFAVTDDVIKERLKTAPEKLIDALNSPFTSAEINLRMNSFFVNNQRDGAFVRSFIHIKGDDMKFVPDADGFYKVVFNVAALTYAGTGAIADSFKRAETIRVKDRALNELREKGLVYQLDVPVKKSGAYQMRVVMQDAATQKIGSASQFIQIPDLNDDRLTLSGIALQQSRARAAEETVIQSDERRDFALRQFRAGADLRFAFAIYNAKFVKPANSSRLTTQFKIFREGKEIYQSDESEIKLDEQTDLKNLNAAGVFTLGKAMASADYILQVIVRQTNGKGESKIAVQSVDFEVVK